MEFKHIISNLCIMPLVFEDLCGLWVLKILLQSASNRTLDYSKTEFQEALLAMFDLIFGSSLEMP